MQRKLLIAIAVTLACAASSKAATAFQADVAGNGEPVIPIPGLASSGEARDGTVRHPCGPRRRS